MDIRGLILNNPKAAFWMISAFWFLASAIPWGLLFSFLGYKVRMNREPDEVKRLRVENTRLKRELLIATEQRNIARAMIKGVRMAIAPEVGE